MNLVTHWSKFVKIYYHSLGTIWHMNQISSRYTSFSIVDTAVVDLTATRH